MLNWNWVSENASFFHFSHFKINLKIRKILFMANKDIFVHFHFSVFLSNRKNAKMKYTCGHFLFFDFSAFNQKRKNRKLTSTPLKFLFFYACQKMEKSQSSLFFVTFSIFWQIGEMSSILLNILVRF